MLPSIDNILAARSSDAAFDELLAQFRPLIASVAASFMATKNDELDLPRDELLQEAQIAFYKAVLSFDTEQDKVTFGLYAKICIKNRLVSYLRKVRAAKRAEIAAKNAPMHPDGGAHAQAKAKLQEVYSSLLPNLSRLEQQVFRGYIADMSYKEIAEQTGVSTKTVDNALWRIKKKVRQLSLEL